MTARIALIITFILVASCQYKAKEEAGELISGHKPVENKFTASVPASGSRPSGSDIDIVLTFPYDVTVTGTPRLVLNVGGTTRYATFVSGDQSKSQTYRYTVPPGDNDTNGIGVTTTIDLNGGTLTFTGTEGPDNCALGFTIGSLTGVKVDTTAPTVSSVSPPANATYYLNMPLLFTATMSEAVTVTGTPRLTLTVGVTTRYATYVSGSGTSTLTFSYTPGATDIDANGIVVAAAIDLNSGTLRDAATNNATLAFVAPNTASVNVNGNIPYVISVTPPANGSYTVGDNLDFVFNFSENVNVTGTPTLSLTIGATTRLASYYSGNGSSSLTFRYVIQAGEVDLNGIASTAIFGLAGATIRDAGATNALNAFVVPSLTQVLVVDGRPYISSFLLNNATYYIGQSFTFTALFNQAVTITGTPRFALTLDTGGTLYANYTSGSGTTNIIFTATVTAGMDDATGVVFTSPLDLNAGTIKNSSNLDANLVFTPPTATNLRVSGVRPTILSITPPANATYSTGQNLNFVVNFSESVFAGNTANVKLNIDIGGVARQASYLSGSGTAALTFRYTVTAPDVDTNGISITAMSVTSTGYITDGVSTANAATLTFTAPNTTGVLVNATAPTVSSITPPANGTYTLAQNVNFTLNYSAAVTVTGTPRLSLTVGSSTLYATYLSGTGTTALVFRYTVQNGDVDSNGIAASTTLDLNGGTVNSGVGVPSSTTLPSQTLTSVLVDGAIPTVTTMGLPSNSLYDVTNVSLNFTVTFDQTVTVTGTPRIVLNAGGTSVYANYLSGSGTSTLTFKYTLAATDVDLDGLALGNSDDIDLFGGSTIVDANGNSANPDLGSRDLSGIKLSYPSHTVWWDFDDTATMATASCGLQTCVSAVTDKTGNSNNLSAAGAAQPELFSSGFSSGNTGYVKFDDVSDEFTASTISNIRTIAIVFETEAAAMTAQNLFSSSAGGANASVTITAVGDLDYGGTALAGWSVNGSALTADATTGSTGFTASSSHILVVRYDSNQTIAAIQKLGSTNFGGKIAEVLIFTGAAGALSDAQLIPIISYLNSKHQVF